MLSANGMVVLNASHNELESLPNTVVPANLGVLNLSFNNLK